MFSSRSNSSLYKTGYKFSLVVIIAWTLSVAGSLLWNVYDERQQTQSVAKNEALSNFNKDLAFRLWATKHGGVYVPATEDTPPNPYLSHIPDRDINLPSGKRLTLMNPAYMLRQIMEDYDKLFGIKGHITSLKPLNPRNMPDAWERKALQDFERGVTEATETTVINGKPYLRLIRPMVVQKGCLKCHAHQGYKEGDIRGGIGISLPLDVHLASERKVTKNMEYTHGLIWLIGMGGIAVILVQGKKRILDHTQAEEALKESEERFRNLVETTSDLVWEVDTIGAYTYVSPRIGEMLGYEPGELLGKTPFDLMAPEESKRISDLFRTIVVSRQPFTALENTNIAKDGRSVVLETSGIPVFDKSGTFQGYRGIDRDITERKKAEEERFASETRFRAVFERSVDAIGVSNTGTHVFVNPAYLNLVGYASNDELRGKPVLDLIAPDEHPKILENIRQRAWGEAVPSVYETRGRRKDGSTFDMDVHASTYELSGATYTLVVLRDITERKRTEDEIRRASQEWSAAMDASEDVIYLLDLDRRVMRANKAFYMMTRSTPETALGKHIVELVHPGGEEVPCPVCLAQEETRDLVYIMEPGHPHNPAGRPIEIILRIVRDHEGRPMSMLMTLHDMTHDRKVQEELTKYREHLEELVKTQIGRASCRERVYENV
jgi:two-component system cell cycle sensor histidine kinase/response regulator CckA